MTSLPVYPNVNGAIFKKLKVLKKNNDLGVLNAFKGRGGVWDVIDLQIPP